LQEYPEKNTDASCPETNADASCPETTVDASHLQVTHVALSSAAIEFTSCSKCGAKVRTKIIYVHVFKLKPIICF
jgi:hypothetical protein